jgi:hypothetical protein
MLKILAAVSLGLAFCLMVASGWLFLEIERQSARALHAEREKETLARRLEDAQAKLAGLEEELARKSRREEELAAAAAAASSRAEEAPPAGEGEKKDPRPAETAAARSLQLRSLGEAKSLAAEFLARGDLDGLLLLAADLLGRGEEGYEKLLELSALAGKELEKWKDSGIGELWGEQEVGFGLLFQFASQHDEDLLRFLIYMEKRSPERELPKLARDLHRGLSEGWVSSLVGFYDGSDPDLAAELTGMYGRRLSAAEPDSSEARSAIYALGRIRNDEAAKLLLEVLRAGAPPSLQEPLVRSLALQRNRQALPELRQLLERTPEGKFAELLRAAIRYLE